MFYINNIIHFITYHTIYYLHITYITIYYFKTYNTNTLLINNNYDTYF